MFVLSSDYEGIPNTLLEAMALGIPCISTDCRPGGAREIITDGEDGIIVPINDKEALAKAVLNGIDDIETSMKHSERAKGNMLRFLPSNIYDNWEQFLMSR